MAEVRSDKSGLWDDFLNNPTEIEANKVLIRQNNAINNPENLTVGVET